MRRFQRGILLACFIIGSGSSVPAGESYPRSVMTNSLGMQLVLIPAGEFSMGASDSDVEAGPDEMPRHRVTVSRPFYLGVHEVTVGDFRAFTAASGHVTDAEQNPSSGFDAPRRVFQYDRQGFDWRHLGWRQTDQHPVLNVNWFDATAFCRWLSQQEGRTYRLPSEAEWEYACRAGGEARFIEGDGEGSLRTIANIQDLSLAALCPTFSNSETSSYLRRPVPWNDCYCFTAPVGSFAPNRFGLYDMLGNAAEWCRDWYARDYFESSPDTDPTGPAEGEGRVVRGGAFLHQPKHCRASARVSGPPDYHNYIIGFRIAMEVDR